MHKIWPSSHLTSTLNSSAAVPRVAVAGHGMLPIALSLNSAAGATKDRFLLPYWWVHHLVQR